MSRTLAPCRPCLEWPAGSALGPALRRLSAAMVALALWSAPTGAEAASSAAQYVDRVQLLVDQASRADAYLARHLRDRELARLVQKEAEGRLVGARGTIVPKAVALAHPHLLLMLEHYERSSAAAAEGDVKEYYRQRSLAADEEQIFRGVLRQLGQKLTPPQ